MENSEAAEEEKKEEGGEAMKWKGGGEFSVNKKLSRLSWKKEREREREREREATKLPFQIRSREWFLWKENMKVGLLRRTSNILLHSCNQR